MNKRRFMLAAMVGALTIGGMGMFAGMGEAQAGGPKKVTMSAYSRVSTGMSYFDVVDVIGFHGEEISRSHMDGVPGVMSSVETVMYQWVNSDGSNMNAMFQNDKLIQKAQFGLR